MKELVQGRGSFLTHLALAMVFLLISAALSHGRGTAQEVVSPNPLPSMAGEWDVLARDWIGSDSPWVRTLQMRAELSDDGNSLRVIETTGDRIHIVRRAYEYAPKEGTVHGFGLGLDRIPTEELGTYDASNRTLTLHASKNRPSGEPTPQRVEWTFPSTDEMRITVYLINSSGQAVQFSEAVCLRRN